MGIWQYKTMVFYKNLHKMKTISGRELKVTSNVKERTFRIKTESATYKTIRMSNEEFIEATNWTGNDWQNFLNKTYEYFIIK
jgi:hypothetical protein